MCAACREQCLALPSISAGAPWQGTYSPALIAIQSPLALGRNPAISTAPSIAIIFQPASWPRGLGSAVELLAQQDSTASAWRADLWIWSAAGTGGLASATRDCWNTLTASESWTTDFNYFNFMHAFHYKLLGQKLSQTSQAIRQSCIVCWNPILSFVSINSLIWCFHSWISTEYLLNLPCKGGHHYIHPQTYSRQDIWAH